MIGSCKQRFQPGRNRLVRHHLTTAFKNGNPTKRGAQVIVVEDPHMWELSDSDFKVGHRAWESSDQFVRGHVMTALRNSHCYTLLGNSRSGDANEAEDDGVPGFCGLLQERQIGTRWIRKHSFEYKALAKLHELCPQRFGKCRGGMRINAQLFGQHVWVDVSQRGVAEMGMEECGLARTIGTGQSNDHRALIERMAHSVSDSKSTA